MTIKKPKEKKSRLKDLKDLLETLPGIPKEEPKKEIPDSLREWLKKNRPKIKPKEEIPDWFKKFLEKNRPELPFPKPMPLEPWKKGPFKHPGFPKPKPFMIPRDEEGNIIPFDPKRGVQLLEAGDSEELIEVFDRETNQNVFISKDKLLEDEGRYSPIRKAGGGIMDIDRMTAPLGYRNGGETKTATASGMHPLVEFKEMYDAWIIDGGKEMPMWDFIEMVTKGIKKG